MEFDELARGLRDVYQVAIRGQKAVMLQVFAIKHARDIIDQEISAKELLEAAGVPESYATDINRALNLSKYVDVKPEFRY